MKLGKDLLKTSIRKICSPRLQSKLRVFYVSRQIIKNQGFHEAEMNLLESLVLAGDCVADVGANVGAYTKELSRLVGSGGKVYSFEPISENYQHPANRHPKRQSFQCPFLQRCPRVHDWTI